MSVYSSLRLHHFRSYQEHVVNFGEGVNIIVGPNGSGKTNLLEALYVLSTGGSFRGHDRDLVRHGEEWFRLEGLCDDQLRVMTYRQYNDITEKQFTFDGTKKARLTHHQRVPVVLFEPDHLRLLRESPAKRRDYIDALLIRLQPDYSWLKHQFERVLAQRNAMLKRRLPAPQLEDQLFAWDVKFVELAQQIVARRQKLIADFAAQASTVYSTIAGQPHTVVFEYQKSVAGNNYHDGLLKQLSERLMHDVERGFTSVGPQRDDFMIMLGAAPAATAASRGEVRSLLLTLKVVELRLLSDQQDTTPLLLLDDVFSELDANRRKALAELSKTCQTLITTTDAEAIVGHFGKEYKIITTQKHKNAGYAV